VFRIRSLPALRVALHKVLVLDFDLDFSRRGLFATGAVTTTATLALFYALHASSRLRGGLDERLARAPLPLAAAACIAIGAALFLLWPLQTRPFIYFQF